MEHLNHEEPQNKKSRNEQDASINADEDTVDLYTLRYSVSPKQPELANAVKFSPDGELLAACFSSGLIRVYKAETGSEVTTLTGHAKGVNDIAFSPIDSNVLVSCSDDLTVRLWSISKKKCIRILKKHTYHATKVCFSSKGNLLISGAADETLVVWDLTSGKSLKTLAAHSDPVSSLCLTPDDSIIISSSYDGLMRLFDLESGQCLKTLVYNSSTHGTATASTNDVVNFPVSQVRMTPNGKYILSSSLDGKIRLWDYMNNKVVKTYYGLQGTKAVSQRYNCGTLFITATHEPLLASGSDDCGILFWDVQSKKIVCQYQQGSTVLELDSLDNGRLLASSTLQGTINLYELKNEFISEKHFK